MLIKSDQLELHYLNILLMSDHGYKATYKVI